MIRKFDPATADLTSIPDDVATLTAAAIAFRNNSTNRPDPKAVVSALVQAEKTAKRQHLTFPFGSLQGRWQLCFTASRKAHERNGIIVGKGWYVPKLAPAHISFSASQALDHSSPGEIGNQIQLGPILLRFTGPCQYPGKKNLLFFDFLQIQVDLLRRTVYQGSFRGGTAQEQNFQVQVSAKLPFFAFFLITEEFIAARGRGGGFALWIKTED